MLAEKFFNYYLLLLFTCAGNNFLIILLLLLFLYKVICLSPTYELALQTGQMAEKMGKFCPEVKIGYAVRGEKGKKLSSPS